MKKKVKTDSYTVFYSLSSFIWRFMGNWYFTNIIVKREENENIDIHSLNELCKANYIKKSDIKYNDLQFTITNIIIHIGLLKFLNKYYSYIF